LLKKIRVLLLEPVSTLNGDVTDERTIQAGMDLGATNGCPSHDPGQLDDVDAVAALVTQLATLLRLVMRDRLGLAGAPTMCFVAGVRVVLLAGWRLRVGVELRGSAAV
jgi:hypothetical protein